MSSHTDEFWLNETDLSVDDYIYIYIYIWSMDRSQRLSLQVKVDFGELVMMGYSTLPRYTELEPHYQVQISFLTIELMLACKISNKLVLEAKWQFKFIH